MTGFQANGFEGLRTLVVEDNAMLSMMLQGMLRDMGCEIVGSAASVDEALELGRTLALDFAILDLNIDGEASYPVADVLEARGIPCLFATGYALSSLPERFTPHAAIAKPFMVEELRGALRRLLAGRRGGT